MIAVGRRRATDAHARAAAGHRLLCYITRRTRTGRVHSPKRCAERRLGARLFWLVRNVLVLDARTEVQSARRTSGQ